MEENDANIFPNKFSDFVHTMCMGVLLLNIDILYTITLHVCCLCGLNAKNFTKPYVILSVSGHSQNVRFVSPCA